MYRFLIHYGIHLIVPILIAVIFFKEQRLKVILWLLAGMLIDLDHLLANPIFDPDRCSIGFHPLHTQMAIIIYCIMPFFKLTRILGLGLIIHIIADMVDCLLI